MNFDTAIIKLTNYDISYYDTDHGLGLSQLNRMKKRVDNMWMPDELVMDDAFNHAVNNMVYNNRKNAEHGFPLDSIEDYTWVIRN